MVQISLGVGLRSGRAIRPRIDEGEVVAPTRVFDVDDAITGVQHTVSAIAAGENAVEHIHPPADALDDVGGGTDAHQVAGFFLWEDVAAELTDAVHVFNGFADGEAADGVARLVLAGDELAGLGPQVIVAAALDDGEQRLGVAVFGSGVLHELHATLEPAVGQVHAVLGVFPIRRVGWAFVEGHHDVGTDAPLDAEAAFGAEQVPRAIDVAGKSGALFGDLAPVGEAEHLVTTAVGQNRAVPVHEFMQATGSFHRFHPRPEVEVVGVAEDDFSFYLLFQLLLVDTFNRPNRTHGHEDRCWNFAVIGGNGTGASGGFGVGVVELKFHAPQR